MILHVTELGDGRRHLRLEPKRDLFVPYGEWDTRYPLELVALILSHTGVWVLDEIMRDESPQYVEHEAKWEILSYLEDGALDGARILDFGSGSGASSMVLARLSQSATIVGVELDRDFVEIARARARFHKVDDRVEFIESTDTSGLPGGIGTFDYVILLGVFEHLLPQERKALLPLLWGHLKPGGTMFVNQTPHRWFPIEHHTTGLPLINYLPDDMTRRAAVRLSSRIDPKDTWPMLLRKGIRGGTHREVMRSLAAKDGAAKSIRPFRFGVADHFDLWFAYSNSLQPSPLRKPAKLAFKTLHAIFGITFVPYISMAIRKTI